MGNAQAYGVNAEQFARTCASDRTPAWRYNDALVPTSPPQ